MTFARVLTIVLVIMAIIEISLVSAQERDRCANPSPQSAFRSAQISSDGILNISITGQELEIVKFRDVYPNLC